MELTYKFDTIPPGRQLAQEVNKEFHKPFTIEDTGIIHILRTMSNRIIFLIGNGRENLRIKHLVIEKTKEHCHLQG